MRNMSMGSAECSNARSAHCCFGHRSIGTSIFRAEVMLCSVHGYTLAVGGVRGREPAWMHLMRLKRFAGCIGANVLLYHCVTEP